jgi:hypothetical protein
MRVYEYFCCCPSVCVLVVALAGAIYGWNTRRNPYEGKGAGQKCSLSFLLLAVVLVGCRRGHTALGAQIPRMSIINGEKIYAGRLVWHGRA